MSLTTVPVRRAEPALAREALGGAVRGDLHRFFGPANA
jgi:hypothetical protein